MYNVFPLLRGCLLGAVAAWTLIVLGIAIHFQMSFVESASQLTYVSLAVFVAAVTLATFLVVLVAPCNRKVSNILRTKWELVWLGILAVLWTALAGYTTTPAAKDSEVECWDEDEDGNVVEANVDGYSNDVYHARYRVLQAFAFFNCILLVFLFLFILALAFWHHKRGRYVIWTTPTTSVGWFDGPTGHGTGRRLPAPVTERKSHKSKGDRYEKWDDEKQVGSGRKRHFNFDKSEETVKDKFKGKISSLKDRNKLVDEEKEDLIKRPPPAATRHNSSSSQLKPRQNLVSVPAGQGRAKPILAPIAAKMAEERQKAETSRDGPDRKPSQREAADKARQQARRDRGGTTDDERPSRPAVRQNSSAGVKRSASNPNGKANASDNERRPAVARRDGSAQPTARAPRRETSQTRAPGVQRSGSGAGNNTGRREPSRTRQQSSNEDDDRYQSKNPYRPSGRRL